MNLIMWLATVGLPLLISFLELCEVQLCGFVVVMLSLPPYSFTCRAFTLQGLPKQL